MSTNYYASIDLDGQNGISSRISLHIGKTSSGATLNGSWFASFEAWKQFLTHNEYKLEIRDENGVTYSAAGLIAIFESYDAEARARQYKWINTHSQQREGNWLDAEGFSFMSGTFF